MPTHHPILILMESAQAECCCYGYLLSLTQLYITSIDFEPGSVGSSGNACVSEMGFFVFPGSVFGTTVQDESVLRQLKVNCFFLKDLYFLTTMQTQDTFKETTYSFYEC